MTEPVARTTPVRRTVRVAVALVAGQAALCAVIGWVTFGPSPGGEHPASSHRVDVLAGPPMTVPPGLPTASPRGDPAPVPARTRVRSRGGATPSATAAPTVPEAPPVPLVLDDPPAASSAPAVSPAASVPVSLMPPYPPDSPPTTEAPRADPTGSATGEPVEAGRPCDDEGAEARTGDGTPVRCEPDHDGELRWQII